MDRREGGDIVVFDDECVVIELEIALAEPPINLCELYAK
jgi:hypothetical protein